jgi:U2 small nuclear ribonucleoprotein B''
VAQLANEGHTLYVNNLFEKCSQDDLKKAMRCIFGQFGTILDVVSRRTYRLRGQAWVVFEKAEDARKAMEAMQGFPFFDKPIRISVAKTKSDAVAKLDGTFKERPKAERRKKEAEEAPAAKKPAPAAAAPAAAAAAAPAAAAAAASGPNHILFVENLPDSATDMMVGMLFQQFTGFKEVRMVPNRPGIAFVEYEDAGQAGVAMQGLQGFKLATDKPMKITFSR